MEKKKCEICGEMKPLDEFSKSYKHRCKACVAEFRRHERQLHSEMVQRKAKEALDNARIVPGADERTICLLAPRYVIAAHALQGMLSNPAIVSAATLTAETVVTLAKNALACATAMMKLNDKEA